MPLPEGIRFATRIHKDDRRKYNGELFINHCLRVMHRTILHPATQEERYAIGAVCHDTVEDHPECEKEFAELFGYEVFWVVGHLTNVYTKEAYPKMNRKERKRREVERLAACTDPIKVIKLIDRIDNLESYLVDSRRYSSKPWRYSEKDDPSGFAHIYAYESINLLRAIGDASPIFRDEGLRLCREQISHSVLENGYNLNASERAIYDTLEGL